MKWVGGKPCTCSLPLKHPNQMKVRSGFHPLWHSAVSLVFSLDRTLPPLSDLSQLADYSVTLGDLLKDSIRVDAT